MKKKISLLLVLCALLTSSGCNAKEQNGNIETQSTSSTTKVTPTINAEYMLSYKDKKTSAKYYEYMLSMEKYDFLDTYTRMAEEYALHGYDFGQAYFGTAVADTEDFWNAMMEDGNKTISVKDIVKEQTLTFAKCVLVFDDIIKDTSFAFSENAKEKARSTLANRVGDDSIKVLSKFGVSYDDALYAELVAAGFGDLKTYVTSKGGAAEVSDKMLSDKLNEKIRYKAVSYYGANKEETKKKALSSYDKIINGTSDFDTELKNSDDYAELVGEYADGTILTKTEFDSTFTSEKSSSSLKTGDIFIASNDQGHYVIMITDYTDSDRQSAYAEVQSKAFQEFLRSYTTDITIDNDAINSIDFLKLARIAPDAN